MRIRSLALTLILNPSELVVYGSSIVLIYNLFSRLSVIKSRIPSICESP